MSGDGAAELVVFRKPAHAVVLCVGHVMRRGFYSVFLPVGAILFLLAYVFLINPDALTEFGRWLQNSQFGPWLEKFL
jgi:hypothetical protein